MLTDKTVAAADAAKTAGLDFEVENEATVIKRRDSTSEVFKLRWTKWERYGVYAGLLAFGVYWAGTSLLATKPSPIVETSGGLVQGRVAISREGREFYEYLGIPFAAPPVGKLRFENPKRAGKWSTFLDATKASGPCLQIDIITKQMIGSEDCLYLNVYAPKRTNSRKLKPVIAYVHGGGFVSGFGAVFKGNYVVDEDVVLVVFQYRLGVFGFLNTGDAEASGNQGLKDQRAALVWVQENIANFGGDPSRVTLMGESAGAASVHFHMLSASSKGLFHRAISQSGTAFVPYCFNDDIDRKNRHLADFFGCPLNDTRDFVDCLKGSDAFDLVQIQSSLTEPPRFPDLMFLPSRERHVDSESFLTEMPLKLMEVGNFTAVPWIAGVTTHEGLLFSAEFMDHPSRLETLGKDWTSIDAHLHFNGNASVLQAVRDFYIPEEYNFADASPLNIDPITRIFSDRVFVTPNHVAAKLHAQKAPVYLYEFNHAGYFNMIEVFRAVRAERSHVVLEFLTLLLRNWLYRNLFDFDARLPGVAHSEELLLQFPLIPLSHVDQMNEADQDYRMSKAMQRTWAQFIHGEPVMTFEGATWDAVDLLGETLVHMNLNLTKPGMVPDPNADRVRFWNSLGPKYSLYLEKEA